MNDLIGRLVANEGVERTAAKGPSAESCDCCARSSCCAGSSHARWDFHSSKRGLERYATSSDTYPTPAPRCRHRVLIWRAPNMSVRAKNLHAQKREGDAVGKSGAIPDLGRSV